MIDIINLDPYSKNAWIPPILVGVITIFFAILPKRWWMRTLNRLIFLTGYIQVCLGLGILLSDYVSDIIANFVFISWFIIAFYFARLERKEREEAERNKDFFFRINKYNKK